MLYEEMLTHSAQNVYNLTTFYKHQHFIHQECFIQKGILKVASGFCLQQKCGVIFIFFIITIGEQIVLKIFRSNFWNFNENILYFHTPT